MPKEAHMQYKMIVLQLLEQHPEIRDQLKRHRQMLPTMERYARELKTRHEAWKDRLFQEMPASDENQIASEALELALKELEDRLPSGSPRDDKEPLSLEGAMASIRRHTPRG
jgi:superfamily I DNA/RNA helicase